MKTTRRTLCTILIAMLLVLIAMPASANNTADIDWGSSTIYLTGKGSGYYGYHSINISELEESVFANCGLGSTNDKVIRIRGLSGWRSESLYWSEDDEQEWSEYYSGSVDLEARKKGTATISINIGDDGDYSHKYKVVSYTNPVKSFILSGVNGSNLKSVFNTSNSASGKLTSNSKEGFLKVIPASGWKVTSLSFYESGDSAPYAYMGTGRGTSSAKLFIPSMKKGHEYSVSADLINTRTKGTLSVFYWID